MRTLPAALILVCAATAQEPSTEPSDAAPAVRVLVGGPPALRERLAEVVRLEVDPGVSVETADAGAMAVVQAPAVLFAAEELLLRRLAADGGLEPLRAGDDLAAGFRDPEGRFALTLVSPITLAFDTRAFDDDSAPGTWEELPFATAGEATVGAIDPAIDPVPMAAWMAMQWEQGLSEDRAIAWLAALDARVRVYSPSHEALLGEMRSGRVSLAALPLHLVHRAVGQGWNVDHRLPDEGLPARALGVALRQGSSESEAAREAAVRLVAAEFTRRCALAAGLVPALREDAELPAAERELLGRLVRPPAPRTVDRWLRRFEAEVRGRGAELEKVDTVLELVFGLLFAGFLFFVYLRLRRSDAREPPS